MSDYQHYNSRILFFQDTVQSVVMNQLRAYPPPLVNNTTKVPLLPLPIHVTGHLNRHYAKYWICSFWSVHLASEVTRYHVPWLRLALVALEGRDPLVKIADKRIIAAGHKVCWSHEGEWWRCSIGNRFLIDKFPVRYLSQLSFHSIRYHETCVVQFSV